MSAHSSSPAPAIRDHSLIPFGDPIAGDRAVSGSKAATLAQLYAVGYPIPFGVVVPTQLAGDDAALIVSELVDLLSAHGVDPPWAVRSSSTVEDGRAAAFPGVFSTVLGVCSADELVAAIAKVKLSLTAETARRYASARSLSFDRSRMGVLVQAQLTPRVAGVAFSRDPVTGEDFAGVEANYGLGESVVSGSVTPDYVRVARGGGIIARQIGTKRTMIRMGDHGIETVSVTDSERVKPAISDGEAVEVAELAWRLEADLGSPQDVEWAIADSTLYLLQSRPITTRRSPQ